VQLRRGCGSQRGKDYSKRCAFGSQKKGLRPENKGSAVFARCRLGDSQEGAAADGLTWKAR